MYEGERVKLLAGFAQNVTVNKINAPARFGNSRLNGCSNFTDSRSARLSAYSDCTLSGGARGARESGEVLSVRHG